MGTSVGLFAKTEGGGAPVVRYREFWGSDKRALLLKTFDVNGSFDEQYQTVIPTANNRFSYRPGKTQGHYAEWPTVVEFAEEEPISGLEENRRGALMAYDKDVLEERMSQYFDKHIPWETFAALKSGLSIAAGLFNPPVARKKLQNAEQFDGSRIRRYTLFPLDHRWCYYSPVMPLWNRPRLELLAQRADNESFFVVRRYAERANEGRPALITSAVPDRHLLRSHAVGIPLRLATTLSETADSDQAQGSMFAQAGDDKATAANLSKGARAYLASLTPANVDEDVDLSRAIWFHSLAVIYAPLYLSEHADAISGDWPRVPLPSSLKALQESAQLGIAVAQLLDVEKTALGVTGGKPGASRP